MISDHANVPNQCPMPTALAGIALAWACEVVSMKPRITNDVPSVVMNEGTLNATVTRPLIAPISAPHTMAMHDRDDDRNPVEVDEVLHEERRQRPDETDRQVDLPADEQEHLADGDDRVWRRALRHVDEVELGSERGCGDLEIDHQRDRDDEDAGLALPQEGEATSFQHRDKAAPRPRRFGGRRAKGSRAPFCGLAHVALPFCAFPLCTFPFREPLTRATGGRPGP